MRSTFYSFLSHYYLSTYITVSFAAHSALECVLHYPPVLCDQHKEFMSAARTPVTNHVFHCTLYLFFFLSYNVKECPKYSPAPAPPPLRYSVLRKTTIIHAVLVPTSHRCVESWSIRLMAICNYNLGEIKNTIWITINWLNLCLIFHIF